MQKLTYKIITPDVVNFDNTIDVKFVPTNMTEYGSLDDLVACYKTVVVVTTIEQAVADVTASALADIMCVLDTKYPGQFYI